MLSTQTEKQKSKQRGVPDAAKTLDEVLHASNNVLDNAFENLGKRAGKNHVAQLIFSRILNNMAESLVPALLENSTKMQHLLGASDAKLNEEVLLMLQMESARSERESEMIRKRAEANKNFFNMLDKKGGAFKVKDVSDLLGITRQTIANQREKNKLIAIRVGHDFRFPGFQFKEGKKINHLEEVLSKLPHGISGVAQTGFFLNEMELPDGTVKAPADVLRSDKPDNEVVGYIINQAALFGRHIAK